MVFIPNGIVKYYLYKMCCENDSHIICTYREQDRSHESQHWDLRRLYWLSLLKAAPAVFQKPLLYMAKVRDF